LLHRRDPVLQLPVPVIPVRVETTAIATALRPNYLSSAWRSAGAAPRPRSPLLMCIFSFISVMALSVCSKTVSRRRPRSNRGSLPNTLQGIRLRVRPESPPWPPA
jgi:hypothetical protein